MNEEPSYIGPEDLVIDKNNHSGGFNVKSILKMGGFSPIKTINDPYENADLVGGKKDKVSDLFDNLVVPSWVLTYNDRLKKRAYKDDDESSSDDDSIVDDDLHERLLQLVSEHNEMAKERKKRSTRKNGRKTAKRLTKKNK